MSRITETAPAAGGLMPAGRLRTAFVLTLPIIILTFKFSILDRNAALVGDWPYFLQIYEAARRSILEHGQFPWWNPWNLGGVPLYANPQFGLVSIQMPLVLLFGTLAGLRLSIMAYMLLGFWGMCLLLRRIGARDTVLAALLSYVWLFSSFPVLHLYVGHLTFATYLLAPWFFLALLNVERPRGWLWFGLLTVFLINQAPHYVTIQMLAAGALVAASQLVRGASGAKFPARLRPYLFSIALLVPLTAHKLFYTFEYLWDFPRSTEQGEGNSVQLVWAALTSRHPLDPALFHAPSAWHEYGAYVSIITLLLFLYAIFTALRSRSWTAGDTLLLFSAAVTLLLALGAFSWFSPYGLLHRLPVFDQMRVPSRWLGWTVFAIILFLARLAPAKLTLWALGFAALDVLNANLGILNTPQPAYTAPRPLPSFEQFASYPGKQSAGMRLFEATQANAGQIFGYEPIVNVYPGAPASQLRSITDRCGLDEGCRFILSGNAVARRFTPNKILLDRTAPGPILLNMNPGRKWRVNGASPFAGMRLFELKKPFLIQDPSPYLTVELAY